MSGRNMLVQILKSILKWGDRFRRLLHLLIMLFVLSLVVSLLSPPRPFVPASAALVVRPEGVLVDELSGDPLQRALALAQGLSFGETLLADLVEAVRQAAGDPRIKALVLDVDGLSGGGLSKLQELAAEIRSFRESGKPVFATGAGFTRDRYYLAAQADQILVPPMAEVLIDGYSSYLPYYKSALDKLYVDYNAWTVGEYKSFTEPYTRNDMSPEDREARTAFLEAMWGYYQRDVEAARSLAPDSLQRYADEFVELLRVADGDAAQLALDYGLVDEILPPDQIRSRIREVVGMPEEPTDDYSAIGHRDYLTALDAYNVPAAGPRRIGLIVASGTILDGMQPPGSVGGESLARLIRSAREDDGIRAIVLRVDSPGGSAYASETIRRELELFRESGRPLVVSMGSVAASGGYWIAAGADEIWASPATLTGSIGVGATFPTIQRTLDRVGVNIDGVGTTRLSGQMDPLQGVGEDIGEYIQLSIERVYTDFVDLVAEGRGQATETVEASAQGRVWIGSEAQARGLVDRLGRLDQAIESAAELAGLAPNSYMIERLRPELSWAERVALQLVKTAGPLLPSFGLEAHLPPSLVRLLDIATGPAAFLEQLNDPRGIYAYCFCDVN